MLLLQMFGEPIPNQNYSANGGLLNLGRQKPKRRILWKVATGYISWWDPTTSGIGAR